jgi:subtilisin family serine protease
MRSLNKNGFLRNLLIMLSIVMIFSFPQISVATSSSSNQKTKPTILAKGAKSGAVIFKEQGAYFYGFSKAKKIINEEQIAPREFIVKYKNHKSALSIKGQNLITTTINKFAAKTKELNSNLGLTLVQLSKDQNYFKTLQALTKNPNVEYAEPNYIVKAQFIPNDPYYAFQWGPQIIKAESAWDKVDPAKRARVTIAILDSGINSSHEDLKGSIIPGYDVVNNDNNTTDVVGHGTHVAGIAAALTNDSTGIAGIASGCKIMPVKVLDDTGSGSDADIIKGIKYATDHGAQVINMSLGGPGSSNALQEAINYATGHGVNIVVAAGNENDVIDTPGNCQGVITVGAINRNGKRASYSNFGPKLDVVAPGTDILSTYIGGTGPSGYTYFSGTSMAAPFVSGVVALVIATNPNLSPAAVTNIIHQSATKLGDPGFNNYYGYGLVNADKAVDLTLAEAGTLNPSLYL